MMSQGGDMIKKLMTSEKKSGDKNGCPEETIKLYLYIKRFRRFVFELLKRRKQRNTCCDLLMKTNQSCTFKHTSVS